MKLNFQIVRLVLINMYTVNNSIVVHWFLDSYEAA